MKSVTKIFAILVAGITLAQADAVRAEPVMIDLGQVAIEQADVILQLTGENSGYMLANCTGCPAASQVRLLIDSDSEATINHQPANFSEINGLDGFTGVIYDPENQRLVRISVFTN